MSQRSVLERSESALTVRNSQSNETKAEYLWKLLRLTLRNTIKAVITTEKSAHKINHGITHVRSVSPNMGSNFEEMYDAALNPKDQEIVVLGANCAYITNWTGRLLRTVVFEKPNTYQKVLFCHFNLGKCQCVAWKLNSDILVLLDTNMHEVNSTIADSPIHAAIFNQYRSELVLGHEGGTSTWSFRYNNQYLVQNRNAKFRSFPSDKFEYLSLEATKSKSQRGFAASGRVVVIFNLESGQIVDYKRNLHLSEITAILYFNPLKLLITASKDGTIKAWNLDWTLKRVLVGHAGPINSLAFYPTGASFISCGTDHTLRLWCLDSPGQLSSVKVENSLTNALTVRGEESFLSISSNGQVDIWKAQDLHFLHTCGGGGYLKLLCSTYTFWPLRTVAMCMDGCVRLISTKDGNLLSTALPPRLLQHGTSRHVYELTDIAYTPFDDSLYACYSNGEVAKFSVDTNPSTLLYLLQPQNESEQYTCLSMYERINNPWPKPNERELAVSPLRIVGHIPLKVSQQLNRCIIFGGRQDGKICVFDWNNGSLQYDVEAHLGEGGVCALAINAKTNILISSGYDQIIRIWNVNPFSIDPLQLQSSFYCSQIPRPLCAMASNFSVALQNSASATFTLVTYDFDVNDRADHSPMDDHSDEIVGISFCSKLGLMASASADGTIRIWNEFNKLIRILELHELPHSIAFCSKSGDLIVGLADDLHFISHEKYLPLPYKVKLMTLRVRQSPVEQYMELDMSIVNQLSKKAVKLLSSASPASRYEKFDDSIPWSEQIMLDVELDERNIAYKKLESQDAEIIRIGEGLEETKKPPTKLTPSQKKSAFERYLDYFYYRPEIEELPTPKSPISEADYNYEIEAKYPKYYPTPEPSSFFSKQRLNCPKPNWIIDPAAFIPNSVLAKLIFPPPPEGVEEKEWRPPGLTDEQLAQINAFNNSLGQRMKTDDTERVFEWEDEEEDSAYKQSLLDVVNAEPPPPTPDKFSISSEKLSSDKIRKLYQPPPETPPPEVEPKPPAIKKSEYLSRRLQPQRQVKKFVRIVEPSRESSPVKIPTPPPSLPRHIPRRPPPPELQLPSYITQFIGQSWFDFFFPRPEPATFPVKPPYTVPAFSDYMMKLLRLCPPKYWKYTSGILTSLLVLHRQFGIEGYRSETVRRTLMRILDSEATPIDLNNNEQRQFVYTCANVIVTLGFLDINAAIELIAFYMIGDDFTRELMLQEFTLGGMQDPRNYFGAEMDSWDPAGGKSDDLNASQQLRRRRQFKKIAYEWMSRWMSRFRRHLERAVARLLQGQALIAAGKRPQGAYSSRRSPAVPSVSSRFSGETQLQRTIDTMQVAIRAAPDVSRMPISAVETINYFCDEMAERDNTPKVVDAPGDRNAVIAPILTEEKLNENVRLPRLGRLKYHECNPERESLCYPDSYFASRPSKHGATVSTEDDWDPLRFTATHLRLPTAVVNIEGPNNVKLNPMPANISRIQSAPRDTVNALMDKNKSSFILLTLKSSPKYFYMPKVDAFDDDAIEVF